MWIDAVSKQQTCHIQICEHEEEQEVKLEKQVDLVFILFYFK